MELETQRVKLEQQQAQMEADRRDREQRNHELMMRLLETRTNNLTPAKDKRNKRLVVRIRWPFAGFSGCCGVV